MQKYKTGSFRGVEFFVAESAGQFGRRNVLHEYPQKDKPSPEDLGRKAQHFSVEAYVLGSDFATQRDNLIVACEAEGPGVLIHPYYGKKYVILAEPAKVTETQDKTRIARISLAFVEAGDLPQPTISEDGLSQVSDAADVLSDAAEGDFSSTFSALGLPDFSVQDAISKIKGAANTIESYRGNVSSIYNNVASFSFAMRSLRTSIVNLLNSPAAMANKLRSALELLTTTLNNVFGTTNSAFHAHSSLLAFGVHDALIPTNTRTRKQQAQNRTAVNALIQRVALAQASKAAVSQSYASSNDALAARNTLLDAMDTIEANASDAVYAAIQDLRAKVSRHVPLASVGLPSLTKITPPAPTCSLVLAHALYGSLDLESDIAARNDIRNPGFIAAGKTLEVLTNG